MPGRPNENQLAKRALCEKNISWMACERTNSEVNTYNKTEQVAEDGNRLGDNPRNDPEYRRQTNPGTNAAEIALVHDIGVAEQTDIDVLNGNVAQNNTGDDDGRHGDSVGHLAKDGTGGSQGGRGDILSGIAIDHGRNDGVHDDFKALKHAQRLGEVSWVFHFGDESEEGRMTTWNDD